MEFALEGTVLVPVLLTEVSDVEVLALVSVVFPLEVVISVVCPLVTYKVINPTA